MDPDVQTYLRTYFNLSDLQPPTLAQRHLLEVDLVLALLRSPRADCLAAAEALAGVRLHRIPAVVVRPLPVPRWVPAPDDRKVVSVARNPRLPTTPAFQRYKAFRVGRTVAECVRRGATRKDLREALGAGWVVLTP